MGLTIATFLSQPQPPLQPRLLPSQQGGRAPSPPRRRRSYLKQHSPHSSMMLVARQPVTLLLLRLRLRLLLKMQDTSTTQ